jgi:hypothetical protein
MKIWVRDNSLSLFFLVIFIAATAGQAIAGHLEFNEQEVAHARLLDEPAETISLGRYVLSSDFGNALLENWQSEYLQFVLFVLATVWLMQRGSTESKTEDELGAETDEQQRIGKHAQPDSPKWAKVGGIRLWLLSNSLVLVMGTIFLLSWFGQSVTGWSEYNAEQFDHDQAGERVSWLGYLGKPHFWEATLQNWQSEFLAVGSMAILSVYLRQRGSTQSKPVGAPHHETASEG